MRMSVAMAVCLTALTAGSVAGSLGPTSVVAVAPISPPRDVAFPGTIHLDVDATDVEHRRVHVNEHVTGIGPGMVLLFPKWLPGNHAPTGPIDRLTGLVVTVEGAPVAWTRDPVDMYAFHLEVPRTVTSVDVAFDYLSPTSAKVDPLEMSQDLMVLDWNALMLYPAGYFARRIPATVSLTVPDGWQMHSALEAESVDKGRVVFKPTQVEALVDSPVFAGRFGKQIDLDPGSPVRVTLDLFADRPELLAIKPEQVEAHRSLVREAYRLFGAPHYAHYDFLYALSDQLAGKGLEHHQSSEDISDPATLTEWDKTAYGRDLLAHEFTHSWNGKFRRPADLWAPNYNVPTQGSLLWVYEGQTEYWGSVLAARAGLMTRQQVLDRLAMVAADYEVQPGRQWRPLADTTNDPIINHHHPLPWRDWTRYKDYYDEGALIWLDADTLIRERSGGKRSLDDFARLFFGGAGVGSTVVTYTGDDVVKALTRVEPYDWETFLRQRVQGVGIPAPLDGLRRGGYRLIFTDQPSELEKALDGKRKRVNLLHSIGIAVEAGSGEVSSVRWGSPAFRAGLSESTDIIAVNGLVYDPDLLTEAIRASRDNPSPLELIVKKGNRVRSVPIEYHGGLRYPHLERDPGALPRLDEILAKRG